MWCTNYLYFVTGIGIGSFIYMCVWTYLKLLAATRTYDKFKYYWGLYTRVISTISALYTISGVYYAYKYEDHWLTFFAVNNNTSRYIISWMPLYLFVDGIFEIPILFIYPNIHNLLVVLHHFIGGMGMYYLLNENKGYYIAIFFAGTELSTPFLNLSWLMLQFKINNILSTGIFLIFFTTFLIARIIPIPFLAYYLYYNIAYIIDMNAYYQIMIFGGSLFITCLNLKWTGQIYRRILSYINYK